MSKNPLRLSDVKNPLWIRIWWTEFVATARAKAQNGEVQVIIWQSVNPTGFCLYIYICSKKGLYIYNIPRVFVFDLGRVGFKRACTRARVPVPFVVLVPCVVPCPACHEVRSGELREQGLPGQVLRGAPCVCVCLLCMFCSAVCPRPQAHAHTHTHKHA